MGNSLHEFKIQMDWGYGQKTGKRQDKSGSVVDRFLWAQNRSPERAEGLEEMRTQ